MHCVKMYAVKNKICYRNSKNEHDVPKLASVLSPLVTCIIVKFVQPLNHLQLQYMSGN